jgi:hypothetical protein
VTKKVGDIRPIGDTRPKNREDNRRIAKACEGERRYAKKCEEMSVE